MSQTEASDMLVKNLMEKPSLTENKTTNGDEQIQAMSLTMSIESPELVDAAILAAGEIRNYRYTREQLIKLKDSPASLKKPDFLDTTDVSSLVFDPERNSFDRKKSETPTENGSRGAGDLDHRRRPGDPRERIRKENDGIVLSPQRRSFNSGCFVPVRETTRTNRSHSPIGKSDSTHPSVREIQPGSRRIGSGRIINNWDYGDKQDGEVDYGFRSSHRGGNERDDKFGERRTFGRDFEGGRDKDKSRRNANSRFNDQRRISESRDEEPEWFSGGPMSQNDTIELRGFDEPEKPNKKKLCPAKAKRNLERANKRKEGNPKDPKNENEVGNSIARSSTPNAPQAGAQGDKKKEEGNGNGDSGKDKTGQGIEDQSFNLDDFLKSDNIPMFANGVGGDGDNTKSRFSAWFKRESPVRNQHDSRRNSLQEDHIIKNIIKDISNEPSVYVPGDSESYFAPISPAANTGTNVGSHIGPSAGSKPLNIMEMLQRSKHQAPAHADLPPNIKGSQMPGKILSLDELEARIRQSGDQVPKATQQKPEEDMTAFNRLLAQVSGGHAVTANGLVQQKNSAPMSLMEMLSHSQQQDEARMAGHFLGNSVAPNMANDIAMKLQQVQTQVQQRQQMELLNKFINPNMNMQQLRTSPLQDMGVQQSRELLSRPEAQAILQGLKRGDLTPQHLYQQLANPALQPRHREMLLAILKLHQAVGVGPSPRVLSPVPPHPMFSQQQQQLRVSPLPPNTMHQRIPSPRELQVHTQNILQRALIKKKLEEQQENFRKREMQQRGQSPNSGNNNPNNIVGQQPVKSQASPTPLAFTPTSVLRKMTAEKDDSKDGLKAGVIDMKAPPQGRALTGQRPMRSEQLPQQWNPHFSVPKPPVGRPIVKANANFQGQPEQFFNQQQQRLMNQQQRKGGQVPQQQPPQNPQTSNYPNHPGASNLMSSLQQHTHPYPNSNQQFSQQLTQQQLRAQHQQHSRPINAPPSSQSQPQNPAQQQAQHLNMGQQSNFAHHQPQSNWHQFLNAQNTRGNQMGRGGITDGDLSPTTTDQLARWFSPDLLERARGGELPSTANLAQHVLSLEEIERQTAPPIVHN